jgi:hypothetical protein
MVLVEGPRVTPGRCHGCNGGGKNHGEKSMEKTMGKSENLWKLGKKITDSRKNHVKLTEIEAIVDSIAIFDVFLLEIGGVVGMLPWFIYGSYVEVHVP